MKWTLHPASEFPNIRGEWQRLCEARYGGHPFLDVRFVESAVDAFADPAVHIAVTEGPPQGIALVHKRSRWVWETFCPSQLPATLFVWDDETVCAGALRNILSATGGQLLGCLHYDSDLHPPLEDSLGLVEALDYAPTMNVSLDGGFEAYWRERSKNLRSNISRYRNRAERDGLEITLEEVTAAADMSAAVAAYGRIESAGWKGQRGSAIHADNAQGRFYTTLMERFAATDGARVFHLHMNGKLVASRMLVQSGGAAIILKTTYDEEYARYAPGRVLLASVLEKLFEDGGLCKVEFYTKASADQLQWATGSRMIRHYNVFRGRTAARLNSWAKRLTGKQNVEE